MGAESKQIKDLEGDRRGLFECYPILAGDTDGNQSEYLVPKSKLECRQPRLQRCGALDPFIVLRSTAIIYPYK